ncbi:hypothetical protein AK812_SmicGene10047 [Symbiodinium microadriaticum]|uniref:Uncharacterized protein n=1 Tax=Symbiodinium microadriaticum TaxID=2951 RepID=A0A1Q9EH26_SYMMI|nr:hypothetical protein AK812_SmicGene10047 [Symbiodinium microadriaticum]CAE7575014.1 unnamed protein product [Symbiodinium microadriaticum]
MNCLFADLCESYHDMTGFMWVEALYKKRHDLDMREQQILRTQGVADTDEALAQRTLQRVLAEKREQDELFDMWRTEVKEARDELHEQIRTSIRKDLAEARENQLHQEIQFQSNAVRRLHEETLKQQHELDTVRDTLQRRHQAAIENYKFSFEIVQEELAECVKERDEYAQELQVHKEANEELKCEVEALEDELESFGRFQAIEAEQQQRLRTLLATSNRDRLVTFFDIWKRYTHGEWESWMQLPKARSDGSQLLDFNTFGEQVFLSSEAGFPVAMVPPGVPCPGHVRATVLARPDGALRRVAGDLEKVHAFCHERGIQVCAGSIFDELLTRDALLSRVVRLLCAHSKQLFILFYAGHGRPGTGDWILEDEDVTLQDILDLWEASSGVDRPSNASLLIISDACYSGEWVKAAGFLAPARVVVQASCGAPERALDGVFISLWLLVQRREVALAFALRHLESLARHPCVYGGEQVCLPELGSGWWPPLLLELPQPTGPPEATGLHSASTSSRSASRRATSRRNSASRFATSDHMRVRNRVAMRRQRASASAGMSPDADGGGYCPHEGGNQLPPTDCCPNGMEPIQLVQQLEAAQQDYRSPVVPQLLHEACMAAAEEALKEALCVAGMHHALAGLLFVCQRQELAPLAQAALCSLWNLASPLKLRSEVAQGSVAHALRDTIDHLGSVPDVLEWSARVAWLLAEEPSTSELLTACSIPEALERAASRLTGSPEVHRWVSRAVCRMDQLDQTPGRSEAENPEWQRQMPSPLHFLRQLRKQLPKRNVRPEEQGPGVLGWVDGAERAALDWQRCLLIRVLICSSSVVQEKMLPPRLLRILRPWMPWRNCRPDPEGMTWMQADGRMRRQVERTCMREVMKQWHSFVASLLPPLQLLFWLRPYIPGRGLAHGEQEEVLSWEQLEKRLRDQSLRYCLLSAFDGWLSWMSAERGPDSVMWVIDTSRWPKARSQFERTWNSAERSQRRAERARQRAARLREEEEERQRALRQRSEEVAAVAHSRRENASQNEEARRRSTLRPYEFPQVLRSDVELSPRRSPRDVASPE